MRDSDVQVASREAAEIIDRHFGHLYDSVHVRKAAAADIATTLRSRELAVWEEATHLVEGVSCVYGGSKQRVAANVKGEILGLLDAKAQSFRKEGE